MALPISIWTLSPDSLEEAMATHCAVLSATKLTLYKLFLALLIQSAALFFGQIVLTACQDAWAFVLRDYEEICLNAKCTIEHDDKFQNAIRLEGSPARKLSLRPLYHLDSYVTDYSGGL